MVLNPLSTSVATIPVVTISADDIYPARKSAKKRGQLEFIRRLFAARKSPKAVSRAPIRSGLENDAFLP